MSRWRPLSDDLNLPDYGLDYFAIVVAHLQAPLGVRRFTVFDDITFLVTLGEFVQAYENAAR
jgi:hypothetical protein